MSKHTLKNNNRGGGGKNKTVKKIKGGAIIDVKNIITRINKYKDSCTFTQNSIDDEFNGFIDGLNDHEKGIENPDKIGENFYNFLKKNERFYIPLMLMDAYLHS
jgi:hypothetical protein